MMTAMGKVEEKNKWQHWGEQRPAEPAFSKGLMVVLTLAILALVGGIVYFVMPYLQ